MRRSIDHCGIATGAGVAKVGTAQAGFTRLNKE